MQIAKRQEASLRYFLGSELQKAKVMQAIWNKYNKADHNTYGQTKKSIMPKNDAEWVKNKSTYDIKYDVDPYLDVMKNVVITIKLNIAKDREEVVFTLNDNFKRVPRATTKDAQKGLKA